MQSTPALAWSDFVEGPAVTPAADLLAWLEGEGAGKLLRVPVVVTPSVLGLSQGSIRTSNIASAGADSTDNSSNDELRVRLDDSSLGVSLADRVRKDCPFDVATEIWVEGVWAPAGSGMFSFPEAGEDGHRLIVRRYAGKVEGEASKVFVRR